MPVNSKKQGQGQTGKKHDDAQAKANKASSKKNTFLSKDSAANSRLKAK
jgi:hypothetical protein